MKQNHGQATTWVLIVLAVLLVGGGAYYFGTHKAVPAQNTNNQNNNTTPTNNPSNSGNNSSGNQPTQWTANRPPAFQDFPISEIFNGPNTAPDFSTNSNATNYRTLITNESKQPANFAGHYRLVLYGCGSNCTGFFVVNLKTGKIISLGSNYVADRDILTRVSSSLLIYNAPYGPDINAYTGDPTATVPADYYVISNNTLMKIYTANCTISGNNRQICQ